MTATVLADADEHNAGIASGVNNAIARVAGLLCIAAIGAVVAAAYASRTDVGETLEVVAGVPETLSASIYAFHVGIVGVRRCWSPPAACSASSASATRAARSAARTAPRAPTAVHSPVGGEAAVGAR